MRVKRVNLSWAVVAPLLAVLLFLPSPSAAQAPYAKVITYEVAEHIKFLGGEMTAEDFKRRFARATLIGDGVAGGPPFEPNPGKKFIDASAVSFISGRTGKGPIHGTFNVLEDFDPTTELLSTLQVVASGTLNGTLDLSTIMATGTAPVFGKWRVRGQNLKGTFQGAFAVPFLLPPIPPLGFLGGYFYIDVDPTPNSCRTDTAPEGGAEVSLPIGPGGALVAFCPVHPEEFLLGFPLTKAVLFLSVD